MTNSPFLTRVVLKNYKSIEACDVDLHSLTFLVGANGAGKSNFLDALRFVADALRTSLDHALREHGWSSPCLAGPPEATHSALGPRPGASRCNTRSAC
jgi:predicted ATPase